MLIAILVLSAMSTSSILLTCGVEALYIILRIRKMRRTKEQEKKKEKEARKEAVLSALRMTELVNEESKQSNLEQDR